jgi:hypothetical protein
VARDVLADENVLCHKAYMPGVALKETSCRYNLLSSQCQLSVVGADPAVFRGVSEVHHVKDPAVRCGDFTRPQVAGAFLSHSAA